MNLGRAIRELRKQKKYTQQEFAVDCGITQTYLSQIENNLKEPNISVLKVMTEKFQITIPILFFLSMEDADLISDKKPIFDIVNPAFRTLIKDFVAANQS